jgi:hypothetical protein
MEPARRASSPRCTPWNDAAYLPEKPGNSKPFLAKLVASTTGETHRSLTAKLVAQRQ